MVRASRRHFAVQLGVGKWLVVLLLLAPPLQSAEQSSAGSVGELPNTDGFGLLAKPSPLPAAEWDRLFEAGKAACDTGCATPFGTLLGAADGVPAYSNCQSACIRPVYSFMDLESGEITNYTSDPGDARKHYIGVIYQCVNYARKWWMKQYGITFPSVDSANEIIYLEHAIDIRSKARQPLARSINGAASRPPSRGDLVVYYADPGRAEWRFGHVAVVVDVDLAEGVVSLAEENYANTPWQEPSAYARQIKLFQVAGRYTLLDIPPGSSRAAEGGRISGWIYPLAR